MDRDEKYQRNIKFMSLSDFNTISELKLYGRVCSIPCFKIMFISELIHKLMRSRNFKKQYMITYLSQDSTFDLFQSISFQFFPQNLSCQTTGAAYLQAQLIHQCLQYTLDWSEDLQTKLSYCRLLNFGGHNILCRLQPCL